jgi:hypothetical protein
MVYILFIISLGLYAILVKTEKYYKDFGAHSYQDRLRKLTPIFQWKISVIKGIAEFMGILCIVAFIFSIFQYWLDHTTEVDVAEATLYQIEQTQIKIMHYAEYLRISFYLDVLLSLLLIILCGIYPVLSKFELDNKFKKYNKYTKTIIYFLTISTSFTFFGSQLSHHEIGRNTNLQIHKLRIIKDNKLLRTKIQNEITNRIVNKIFLNPKVSTVLEYIQEIEQNISLSKDNTNYQSIARLSPPELLKDFQVNIFEREYKTKYNLIDQYHDSEREHEKRFAEKDDQFRSKKSSPKRSGFTKSSQDHFESYIFPERDLKKANEILNKAAKKTKTTFSRFYVKFQDPIEKIIRKGYDSTGAVWISSFFKSIGFDFPFLDQFLDPIINDPLEDRVTKVCADIYSACSKHDKEQVANLFKEFEEKFEYDFQSKVDNSQKFSKLNNTLINDLRKSKDLPNVIKQDLARFKFKANAYMEKICSTNKFEILRIEFYNNLLYDHFPFLPEIAKKKSLTAFRNWERQKKNITDRIYVSKSKDIDAEFFAFSKTDPHLLISWAYCLLASDPSLRQPVDALKYYFKLHQESYDDFFNGTVDESYRISMLELNTYLCGKHTNNSIQ